MSDEDLASRCWPQPHLRVPRCDWSGHRTSRELLRDLSGQIDDQAESAAMIGALAADLAAANATIAAQALVIGQYREALKPFEHHAQVGDHAESSRERSIRVTEGQLSRAWAALATPPTAAVEQAAAVLKAGEALRGELSEVAFGWDLGLPERVLADAQKALDAWDAAMRGAGSGESRHK